MLVFLQLAKTFKKTCFKPVFRDFGQTGFETCLTEITKKRFKTSFLKVFASCKKPTYLRIFPSPWCRFQSVLGTKNFFSIFLKKRGLKKRFLTSSFQTKIKKSTPKMSETCQLDEFSINVSFSFSYSLTSLFCSKLA